MLFSVEVDAIQDVESTSANYLNKVSYEYCNFIHS